MALTAFERSDALRPHAVTTYNIGYCERALGRYTRARKMFGAALAENAAHGGVELPEDLSASAKTYLGELERQIAYAVVSISPEGASILVDGRPLERAVTDGPRPVLWAGTREPGAAEVAAASTFELHVDPGTHVFVVSKASYADSVSTRTFESGTEANLVLALSPPAPVIAAPLPAAVNAATDTRPGTPSRVPLLAALGVGAVGLATGVTAGTIAIVIKNRGPSHYEEAGTPADVSTVGFVVGGAGVVAGALYWLFAMRETPATTMQPTALTAVSAGSKGGVQVSPWLGPAGGGVVGTF